jgi:hypothetical protein
MECTALGQVEKAVLGVQKLAFAILVKLNVLISQILKF